MPRCCRSGRGVKLRLECSKKDCHISKLNDSGWANDPDMVPFDSRRSLRNGKTSATINNSDLLGDGVIMVLASAIIAAQCFWLALLTKLSTFSKNIGEIPLSAPKSLFALALISGLAISKATSTFIWQLLLARSSLCVTGGFSISNNRLVRDSCLKLVTESKVLRERPELSQNAVHQLLVVRF